MAGIYIHIPFCKQACHYCNFHFSTSLKLKHEVIAVLHQELMASKDYLNGQAIDTIYLGGGTPSLLQADEIKQLFETICTHYNASNIIEFTLEANPDDLNANYLRSLKSTPINRFSIGIQSFHDADLRYMRRAHHAQQADYAIKAAQDAGFTNLTIDLIYGTPGLTDELWKQNLNKLKTYQLPHFSSYALTVEEGTALHHSINKKNALPADPIQAANQFEILMEEAAALGYEHYEISNFALPGHHAIHNTNYWLGVPYLGIGPSAHSFNGSSRRWNIANNALYIKNFNSGISIYEEEHLNEQQQVNEYIMTSLRTQWGCNLNHIASKFGSHYAATIQKHSEKYISKAWMLESNHHLILTNAGKLFADKIASELFF
jgi:oxygen-independent coproporphyrinogen-3 oxidase